MFSQECTPGELECSEECGTSFRTCGSNGFWNEWNSTGDDLRCQNGQLVSSNGCVIPVELTDFTFEQNDQIIKLTWQTLNEIDLDKFEIERQFEGEEFKSIGVVSAYNSSKGGSYNFEDEFLQEVQYYRLISVDFDGYEESSKIIGARRNNSKFYIYPTLVRDNLNVSGNIGPFQVFDIYGNFIIEKSDQQIDVSFLSAGSYLLISGGQSSKFVKVD